MRHFPAVILSFAVALPAAAQDMGYAGQQSRDIRALSAQETADLLAGRGMCPAPIEWSGQNVSAAS